MQAVLAVKFGLSAPMVKALVECHIRLPTTGNREYLTAQADEYGASVKIKVPNLYRGHVIAHPFHLQFLLEQECHAMDGLEMLRQFADVTQRSAAAKGVVPHELASTLL